GVEIFLRELLSIAGGVVKLVRGLVDGEVRLKELLIPLQVGRHLLTLGDDGRTRLSRRPVSVVVDVRAFETGSLKENLGYLRVAKQAHEGVVRPEIVVDDPLPDVVPGGAVAFPI